jgi:hypothetical protein
MNDLLKGLKMRFLGVIKEPEITLGNVMYDKKWQNAFAFLLLAAFLMSFLTAPAILKLNFEKNPELYASFPDSGGSIGLTGRVLMGLSASFVYFFRLVFIAFFVYLFYNIFGFEGLFVNYFSLVANSALITVFIPEFLKNLIFLITGNLVNPFNLGILISVEERTNILFFILSTVDIFNLWFVYLIAHGVFGFYKNLNDENYEKPVTLQKSFIVAVFYFVFKSVSIVLFSYLLAKLSVTAQSMLMNN